jgi:type IV pilus assembly protein PilB
MATLKRKSKQLGQILLEQGLLTPEQLDRALEEHRNTPKSLGRVLIDMGYIRERDLVRALAEQVGLEFVDLTDYRVDPGVTALLPEALCRRYRALPTASSSSRCPTPPTCSHSTTSAR